MKFVKSIWATRWSAKSCLISIFSTDCFFIENCYYHFFITFCFKKLYNIISFLFFQKCDMSVFYIPMILYYTFFVFCFIFIVYISRYVISKSCQTVSINSKNKYIFYLLCYSFFNVMRTMVISSVCGHSLPLIIILISCFTNSIIAVKFSCFCSKL